MVSLVSKKYAEALYRVGVERKKVDILLSEAKELQEIFTKEKTLSFTLCHPEVSLACKNKIIDEAFDNKIQKEFVGLFHIILRKSRQEFISEILSEFIDRCNFHNNSSNAELVSAYEIDEERKNIIKENLERKLNKKINLETRVDEKLIAGFKIRVNDLSFNRTIDEKINNIREAII